MDTRPGPSQQSFRHDNLNASEFALGVQASISGLQLAPDGSHHPAIPTQWPQYHHNNPAYSSESRPLDYFSYHAAGLTNQQEAWTPLQVTGVPTQTTAFIQPHDKPYHAGEIDAQYPSNCQYSPGSEHGGKYHSFHSDSGYGGSIGKRGTNSVSTSFGVNSSFGEQGEQNATGQYSDEFSDVQLSERRLSLLQDLRCEYPGCKWKGKCPSDKKKHEARHRKLFKCDAPKCTRKDGFGTLNDLARHKKCVHNQDPERGPKIVYMCFADNCPRRNKRWPRLDNFRQHLNRMHADECAEELVKRSMEWYEKVVKPQQSIPSVVDRLSQAEIKYETQPLLESEGVMPGNQLEMWDSIAPAQDMIPTEPSRSSEDFTLNPIKSFPVENTMSELSGLSDDQMLSYLQSMNLPSLMSLNLPATADQTPTPRGNGQNGNMDGCATAMAGTIINAMSNFMNDAQQRRSQVPHLRGDSSEQRDDQRSIWKKDMMQKILCMALNQLTGNSNANPQTNPPAPDKRRTPDPPKEGWIQCDHCEKQRRRHCDMNKHVVQSHERPFGCTFAKCHQSLGSKSDWKRHENDNHFRLECWRCDLPDLSGGGGGGGENRPCAQLFHRQNLYVEHLETVHGVNNRETVQTSVSTNRIGRNGMGRYWCGYCCKILPITRQGLGRANERFDHIDFEHIKKGERIDQWVPEYGHLTKGQEAEKEEREREERERLKIAATAAQGSSGGDGIDYSTNRPGSRSRAETNHRKRKSTATHDIPNQYLPGNASRTKRQSTARSSPRRNTMACQPVGGQGQPGGIDGDSSGKDASFQEQDYVFCCMDGAFYKYTTVQCIPCNHELCGNCEPKRSSSGEEGV